MQSLSSPVAALALLAAAAGSRAQQPVPSPAGSPPSFAAEVELVTVDAVVTDARGKPVAGLTREEFLIEEDGKPQAIESFEAVRVPGRPSSETSGLRPRVSTNLRRESPLGRTFVIVFDDLNISPFMAPSAKAAVDRFLASDAREGDRVLLTATGGSAWWSARLPEGRAELVAILKRLEGRSHLDTSPDRLTPYEAMRIHLYRDLQVAARVGRRFETYGATLPAGEGGSTLHEEYRFNFENPRVLARAQQVYVQATSRNRVTLRALERVLDSLGGARGRKAVILVSEGFIYDPNVEEFKGVLEASRRGNAAVYFLDARGLEGMPLAASAEFGQALTPQDFGRSFSEGAEASEGSELIASDSGGFSIKNSNDLGKGLGRIAEESEAYYLLGYRSDNPDRDGRFRRIRVKLARKGLDVRARAGYYAPLEGQRPAFASRREAGEPELEAALNSPFDEDGLALRAAAFVFDETLLGKARVVLAAELDLRGLAPGEREGGQTDELQNVLVVTHRDSGETFRFDQKVELKLLPGAPARLGRDWYALARDLDLPPGRYQARVVLRDTRSRRIGSLTHGFDVPELGELRISTPILSDQLHQERGAGPRPVLVLRRSFPADSILYAEYQVYGAARDAAGQPRVTAGFEILGADGSLMRVEPSPIKPSSLGRLSRIAVAPLRGAPPGRYELVLRVKDEVAERALEIRELFALEAAEGSD